MRIGLFGGSFDPVHKEHVKLAKNAVSALGLDRLYILPSFVAPHKLQGSNADGRSRAELCKIAFQGIAEAVVDEFELKRGETSYSYITCAHFRERFPEAEIFFLVGADMLENFPQWRRPEEIVSSVTLAACGRAEGDVRAYARRVEALYGEAPVLVPFTGEDISSTRIRVELAFGKAPAGLDGAVLARIRGKGLYTHPAIAPALALEKEERREHSFRTALTAVKYAKREGISEARAILACALHDCGKYVSLSSPLLAGFTPPEGVPAPVLHQYTGAYIAEHAFGIEDGEVLDAIRYHTSGKEGMSALGKLVLVADMVEDGRDFPCVGELRSALDSSLDEGLVACLARQIEFLREREIPVYPLSERALTWAKGLLN